MSAMWNWIVSVLVWLSAGDATLHDEPPKAAAAVAVARASMETDSANVLP